MSLKGLFILFFTLASTQITFSKGDPEFSPLTNLAEYYKPILKSTPDLVNSEEEMSTEKVNGLFSEMVTLMRIEMNEDVLSYIRHYTTGQKENFEVALSLERVYATPILKELSMRNMPAELSYLPIALTGMHNQSITPNNGTGIWGLNYYIAVKQGLKINDFSDERKDPAKATSAALDYLASLYDEYKSWNLAITAFATSKALVNKAIKKSGNKTNYWDIAPFLPIDARNIIPSFFASVYLVNFYPEHDLNPPGLLIGQNKERIEISEKVSLELLSKKLEVSEQTLLMMNPTFRGKIIYPAKESGVEFYVPDGFTYQVAQVERTLYDETRKLTAPKKVIPKRPPVVIPEGKTKIVYRVKSGDFLGKIAETHRVRVSHIKRWNYLRSDRINIGQRLTLYVDPALAKSSTKKTASSSSPSTINLQGKELVSYTIKEGDTLWGIVKDHPGNDVETILKVNGISPNIQPGQVIKIIKAQ